MISKASRLLAAAMLMGSVAIPAHAQQDELQFSEDLISDCIEENNFSTRRECIGVAASQCQEATPMGSTTVGMGFCLNEELSFWDARLNTVYKQLTARDKRDDADAKAGGWLAPEKFPLLRKAQRKWIEYRDATCDYEMSLWGGGTGGGPAVIGCLMSETAERTLELESILGDRS